MAASTTILGAHMEVEARAIGEKQCGEQ